MKRKGHLLFSLGLLFLIQAGGGICWSQTTERVSVDSAGGNSNDASNSSTISSDGRYVAFQSAATDLVPLGSNGLIHIFLHDRQTGTTTQVSVNSGGEEGDFPSSAPSISGDGRYLAFQSQADNLIAGDNNLFPLSDMLLHDRQTGTISLVSVDWNGIQGDGPSSSPSISADGRYVAFESEADLVNGDISFFDIFVRDLLAGTTILVSVDWSGAQADGNSYSPSISGDGRYVAFESTATDLLAVVTNGNTHIFVRDLLAGTTTIVSVDSGGTEGNGDSSSPSISDNGRYVAFESLSTNLVAGDTNNKVDVFVRDLLAGTTILVSVDWTGAQADGDSRSPSISADGRYVAFESDSTDLLAGGTNGNAHVFVRDLQTGITTIVSVDSGGTEGNGDSSAPSISSLDGKFVAFESIASNLVAVDTNGFSDIFVYERESLPPNVDSTSPADSANGVAVGSSITATFSEPMNGSTIDTNTFTLDNGVTGTVSYDANSTTATFTPTRKLDYDTTYIATITTAVRDLADNTMLADFTWTFTTKSEKNNSGGSGPCFIATAASDWADF